MKIHLIILIIYNTSPGSSAILVPAAVYKLYFYSIALITAKGTIRAGVQRRRFPVYQGTQFSYMLSTGNGNIWTSGKSKWALPFSRLNHATSSPSYMA